MIQILFDRKWHRWALGVGVALALLLFSAGGSGSAYAQSDLFFGRVGGLDSLDLASATDMRWLQFKVSGIRYAAPTAEEQVEGNQKCELGIAPGWRAVGVAPNASGGKRTLCFPPPEAVLDNIAGHETACRLGFGKVFSHREGTVIFCAPRKGPAQPGA